MRADEDFEPEAAVGQKRKPVAAAPAVGAEEFVDSSGDNAEGACGAPHCRPAGALVAVGARVAGCAARCMTQRRWARDAGTHLTDPHAPPRAGDEEGDEEEGDEEEGDDEEGDEEEAAPAPKRARQ